MKSYQFARIALLASAYSFFMPWVLASNAAPVMPWKRQALATGAGGSLIQGNQPLAAWSREDERCFEYPLYTVIESSRGSLDQLSISVFPAKTKCKDVDQSHNIAPVFQVKNDAEFFAGLIGSRLVTDTGSGTDGRILTIYDVPTRSKLRAFADFYEDVQLKKGSLLYFWVTSARATPQNCAIYYRNAKNYLGSAIEKQIFVNLDDNTIHATNRRRCNTRQTPVH